MIFIRALFIYLNAFNNYLLIIQFKATMNEESMLFNQEIQVNHFFFDSEEPSQIAQESYVLESANSYNYDLFPEILDEQFFGRSILSPNYNSDMELSFVPMDFSQKSPVPMDFSQKSPLTQKKARKYTQKSVASEYEASLDPNLLKNLFNNMPGYTIGAIIQLIDQVFYNQNLLRSTEFEFSQRLQIQKALRVLKGQFKAISTKLGLRSHLRIYINDVEQKHNQEIKNKKKKYKYQTTYLKMLTVFSETILNEAKNIFRQQISRLLTTEWIHNHCQKRHFKGTVEVVKIRREIFQKYLIAFKLDANAGKINENVDRTYVLGIPLFQHHE